MEIRGIGGDREKEVDIILTHVERIPDLVSGTIGGYFKNINEHRDYWNKIAREYNAQSLGKPRSGRSIKKKWQDLKSRIKVKIKKHILNMNATGGSIFPLPSCGEIEDRVLKLTGTIFVDEITKDDLATAASKLKHHHNPVTSTFTVPVIRCEDSQLLDGILNAVGITQEHENDMKNSDIVVLPESIETAGSQVESVDNSRDSLQDATSTTRATRSAKTAAARSILKKSLRKPYKRTQTNPANTTEPTSEPIQSETQLAPQQSYQNELLKLEHEARIKAIQAELIATQTKERAIRAKEMASQAKEKSHNAKYWAYKEKEKAQQTKERAQEAKRQYYEYKLAKLKKL